MYGKLGELKGCIIRDFVDSWLDSSRVVLGENIFINS